MPPLPGRQPQGLAEMLRSLAIVGFGFSLLVFQSALGMLVPIHPWSPNLLLPIVIFLGVVPDVHLLRGAAMSFVLGYLLDVFSGNLMSLQTFVMVATFILSRVAGLRLFLRGPAFQILLTLAIGVLAGGVTMALRGIFEPPPPFAISTVLDNAISLFVPPLVTSLAAPFVFVAVRRIESLSISGRDDIGSYA